METREDVMTSEQFETILEMIRMILDSCEDLDEAKRKVDMLLHKAEKQNEE